MTRLDEEVKEQQEDHRRAIAMGNMIEEEASYGFADSHGHGRGGCGTGGVGGSGGASDYLLPSSSLELERKINILSQVPVRSVKDSCSCSCCRESNFGITYAFALSLTHSPTHSLAHSLTSYPNWTLLCQVWTFSSTESLRFVTWSVP
jgi:hypothetical protein